MELTELEQVVARLKNSPPWVIYSANEHTDSLDPTYTISSDVIDSLIIKEANLKDQIDIISCQIQYWGRLEAMARRAMVISDRMYRCWKSKKILSYINHDPSDKSWKKPTDTVMEAMYRNDLEYNLYQIQMEKNEEAYNATHMVLEGFKAKREMLKLAVNQNYDASSEKQSI